MYKAQSEAHGAVFSFSTLVGEVIATDQRSDSITTGSTRTTVVNGIGRGSGTVDTEVVVKRDIWLRTSAGDEHHVRITADLPIRVGERISIVSLRAKRESARQEYSDRVTIYYPATQKYWKIVDLSDVATKLSNPNWTTGETVRSALVWLVAFGLIFAVGIGVLVMLALLFAERRRVKRCKMDAVRILEGLEAEHRIVLQREHDAWRRDVELARETPAIAVAK